MSAAAIQEDAATTTNVAAAQPNEAGPADELIWYLTEAQPNASAPIYSERGGDEQKRPMAYTTGSATTDTLSLVIEGVRVSQRTTSLMTGSWRSAGCSA